MIIKKDSEIVKAKGERKYLALKAKKESSDEECSTSGSEDEEYAMAVKNFKKFFKRRECLKPPKDKNQRAFVGGSWSDNGEEDDEKVKDETCLMTQASNETSSSTCGLYIVFKSPYSDKSKSSTGLVDPYLDFTKAIEEILWECCHKEDTKFENFSAPSLEMLNPTFDRLQKLRNKADMDTISMDDLYNNCKVYEPEVKGMSSSNSNTQNMVFLSSTNSSTNGAVNTANGVSTASTKVNVVFYTNIDNLSDAVISTFLDVFKMQIAMLTMRAIKFMKKTKRKLIVNGKETLGFDMSKVECYNCHKRGHFTRECKALRNQDNKHKESTRRSVPMETLASIALVSCDGLGGYDWSDQGEEGPNYALMAYTSLSSDSKKGLGYENYNAVPPLYTGNFMPLKPDLSYTSLDEFAVKPVVENKSSKVETKAVRKNTDAPIIEEWVSDDKEENVSQPEIIKKIVWPSIVKKEFVKPRQQEKTARKTVKKGNPQMDLQDKGVIDSGCSRHMIGNMSYFTDYEEIDRGYVAFRGNPKGGKITRKDSIKTGKLDFENVYFVRELKFNLFSVLQICDKKNSVLFNDTECIVLPPNFKLIDESHVLLRVPRKNNMYSFDLKNIVPKGDLTYLFEKATFDESKLWHRRLGYLNFKTMNKLVKENLVRGTKDETSGILKSIITRIENLVDHKVKVIRCDNETEFKNREMNQFCKMKGTKDETSGILKSIITRIENLVDHKVKVIRCDNETEFKNREMNQFCKMKVKVVPTARRLEMPLPGVCTAIEEMMKKLSVKDR
nr:hypothetical protein [Tanacetum cinerariifolium]